MQKPPGNLQRNISIPLEFWVPSYTTKRAGGFKIVSKILNKFEATRGNELEFTGLIDDYFVKASVTAFNKLALFMGFR